MEREMGCILMDCLVNVDLIILMTMRRVSCSGFSGFNVCVIRIRYCDLA